MFGRTLTPTGTLFRRVTFDIAVEGEAFVVGLDSLSTAIAAFLHLCFVAHLEYPQVNFHWIHLNKLDTDP